MDFATWIVGPENGLWIAAVVGFFFMAVIPLSMLLIVSVAAKRRPYSHKSRGGK